MPVVKRSYSVVPLVIDLALILVFATIGRLSHGEDLHPTALFITWWPFALGAIAGWILCYFLSVRIRTIAGGLITTVICVAIGMGLRLASGQDVQTSFVIVASIFLFLFLVTWRVIDTTLVRRRRAS